MGRVRVIRYLIIIRIILFVMFLVLFVSHCFYCSPSPALSSLFLPRGIKFVIVITL